MRAKYLGLILIPLLMVAAVLLSLLAVSGETHNEWQRVTLCVAALFCNVFVLGYHATTPPHPKFLLLRRRKIAIRIHAISGGLEIVTGVIAYFTVNFTPIAGVVMALVALLLHIPTATYQASIVFGAKAVMTPVYAFVILVHAFCAAHLLLDPRSQVWIVSTFLALNAYVWCRVLIWLFLRYGLFPESTYSVAITLAAMISVSSTIGFTGSLLLLGFVFAYAQLYRTVMKPSATELAAHSSEHGRESLVDDHFRRAWEAMEEAESSTAGDSDAEQARARVLFDAIDEDHNGVLSPRELSALVEGKLPWQAVQAFIDRHGRDGEIPFDVFYRHFYRVHGLNEQIDRPLPSDLSLEQKARLVFGHLDLDHSGAIDAFELRQLLLGWGLPAAEVSLYLQVYASQSGISFDEFFTEMQPIWRFGFRAMSKKKLSLPG